MKLFRETFRFTGGEIVGEFLMSLGYLKGAHVPELPGRQEDRPAEAALGQGKKARPARTRLGDAIIPIDPAPRSCMDRARTLA